MRSGLPIHRMGRPIRFLAILIRPVVANPFWPTWFWAGQFWPKASLAHLLCTELWHSTPTKPDPDCPPPDRGIQDKKKNATGQKKSGHLGQKNDKRDTNNGGPQSQRAKFWVVRRRGPEEGGQGEGGPGRGV